MTERKLFLTVLALIGTAHLRTPSLIYVRFLMVITQEYITNILLQCTGSQETQLASFRAAIPQRTHNVTSE